MQQQLLPTRYKNAQYTFVCDDTLHFLSATANESVRLVITSSTIMDGKSKYHQ